MNQVEARILDLVAELFPDLFAALTEYQAAHADFLDQAWPGSTRKSRCISPGWSTWHD